jgi:hypothetical protein
MGFACTGKMARIIIPLSWVLCTLIKIRNIFAFLRCEIKKRA